MLPRQLKLATDTKNASLDTLRELMKNCLKKSQGDGDFSNWQPVDTALETKASLTGQQRGIHLEYRIKAINTGGESSPSNTAAVVL